MKRLIVTFTTILSAIGCTTVSMEEVLLSRDDISLTRKGELQIAYNSRDWQLGFNDIKNEYRVYDDRMADWFVLTCSERPDSQDQTLRADVTWTGKKGTMSFRRLEFKVERTDETGKVWLWNESERIGIIIQNIL